MGPRDLALGILEQWKPWLPLASCIMQRKACMYKCVQMWGLDTGRLCFCYYCGVWTCGHSQVLLEFSSLCAELGKPLWRGGTCIAPAPCPCDDLSGDRSGEVEGLCVATLVPGALVSVLNVFFLHGDGHVTSPSEARTLQICPRGSVHDHCLVSQSFISSLAVLCVFMGFLRWQSLINPDTLLCKDTQKFTGVGRMGASLGWFRKHCPAQLWL